MHIVLCLDQSSFTQKILATVKDFANELKEYNITVIHIIDETLFTAGTGFEIQLNENLRQESEDLKDLCKQQFGDKLNYIEEYGIPAVTIRELLGN